MLFTLTAFGQDYREYQRCWNRVDEDVLSGQLHTALTRMDTLDGEYDFIFARHCIKGLQVAVAAGDSLRAAGWLQRCFTRGVPLWIIRMNELMRPALHYANTQPVVQDYDSLRSVYYSSLHPELVHLLDSLITIDQWHTHRVNNGFVLFQPFYWMGWIRNNKRQFKIIKPIIEKYGYPGEYLVGLPETELDSAKNYKNKYFWGPLLFEDRAEIMLIHYFSQPRDDINALLYPSLLKGYLPSDQYGNLNDFLAEWGKRKYRRKTYYNTWHWDPDTTHIPAIDLRRDSIGLNTFAQ